MAYNATYTADDLAPAVVDTGLKVWVQISAFASIFALILVVVIGAFLMRKARRA